MVDFFTQVEELKMGLQKRIEEVKPDLHISCTKCGDQYMDLAISGIIPALKGSSDEIARSCLAAMVKVVGERGVAAMPLTNKAWTDLCEQKGWRP